MLNRMDRSCPGNRRSGGCKGSSLIFAAAPHLPSPPGRQGTRPDSSFPVCRGRSPIGPRHQSVDPSGSPRNIVKNHTELITMLALG
jgi:hypothetical protein